MSTYNAGEFKGLFKMLPKSYHVHTISMLPSTLARRMFYYYYDWKQLLDTFSNVKLFKAALIFSLIPISLSEPICPRPALQADEWGRSRPIDLSTFPPLCIPAHSWFPPGLSKDRIAI